MTAPDPLQLLRTAIGAGKAPFLSSSSDPSAAETSQTDSFVDATDLYFSYPSPLCLPLNTTTRFISTNPDTREVDLRSIFFAWLKKDATVPEYLASATELDKELPQGQKVRNLVFVERIDLITWLEGASEESEYIKPLEGHAAEASKAADVAGGAGVPAVAGSGVGVTQQSAGGRPVKVIDARLQAIYKGERRMGDHNTVLRGIKPTDFSHIRKHTESFLGRRQTKSQPQPSKPTQLTSRPVPTPSKPLSSTVNAKRSDPIILLSPSASSLLRMSNIKTFLDTGLFVPFDHPTLSSQTASNLLHLTRNMRSLSDKPYRFIIVESPENFKPEYWSRVVAVFTTGQTWQFRGYKWREPQELFAHVMGVYVGEKGAPVPGDVRGWGNGVRTFSVDRWDERSQGAGVEHEARVNRRWRDREVVEEVWRAIEGWMRGRGEWKRN